MHQNHSKSIQPSTFKTLDLKKKIIKKINYQQLPLISVHRNNKKARTNLVSTDQNSFQTVINFIIKISKELIMSEISNRDYSISEKFIREAHDRENKIISIDQPMENSK